MPPRRIVDASPLILLSKAGRLDLLRLGKVDVIVPTTVLAEVRAKGIGDVSAEAVDRTTWLIVVPSPEPPASVIACGIDQGEASVLALALDDPGCEVVIDDRAGRGCARRLGVPCLGTLGLVLLARRLGEIAEARPVIEELRRVGLYLDGGLVEEILGRIGE